jgi:CRP-like cAMP-binding protein
MATTAGAKAGNSLLELLPTRQLSHMLGSLELAETAFGQVLCKAGQAVTHVYFPLTAFISLVIGVDRHPPLELGLIGSEGMLGASLLLGIKEAPFEAVVQGAGIMLQMQVKEFTAALETETALAPLLRRYQYVQLKQQAQTVACTRFHEVNARLVRWLLMTHDRAHRSNFHLTHQFLADMLGVQRSAVTIAAGVLQQLKLISYSRGDINILNRKGLEALSCECYEVESAAYQRLLA